MASNKTLTQDQLTTTETILQPSALPHSLPILFRLSRPRTWVFTTSSFLLGFTTTSWTPTTTLVAGLIVACLVTAATNIVNAYADRYEDAINQPTRVFWLDKLGHQNAIVTSILLYTLAAAIASTLGALFLLVVALGIFNSTAYSLPPLRFKARPLPSLLSFSGAVALPFLSGLAAHGSLDPYNPLLMVTAYFMLTYGTVKNLPDYEGDKKTRTRTTATIFQNIQNATLFAGTLLYTPYVLLAGFIIAGILPVIYVLNMGFVPLLTIVFVQMRKGKNAEELEKTHTLGYFYAISFLLFTLVLSGPSLESIVALTALLVWSVLVSKVHMDSRTENPVP